jgi:hypothetical protein
MTKIGFSTGALALGDFKVGLNLVRGKEINAVELSALRVRELPELMEALPNLQLKQFSYVAIHAPSLFSAEEEDAIVAHLKQVPNEYPIIVHPDTIHEYEKWGGFRDQLLIENMDRRKSDGRTAKELSAWFDRLPSARFCFDLAHARHFDSTMTEASLMISQFRERICQVHISELDSASHHFPLSYSAVRAFSEVSWNLPKTAAFIIESRVRPDDIGSELDKVRELISEPEPVLA